jgi:hypothetical protein
MTEAEWKSCDDPGFMLDHLESKVSDRKLRLFATACCRRMWHLLTDERSRRAVEVTEEYADGLASLQAFQAAMEAAGRVSEEDEDNGEPTPGTAAWLVAYYPPFDAAYTCGTVSVLMDRERMKNQPDWWTTHEKEGEEEARHQVALVHCIVGNPFRPAVIDPSIFHWNDGTVVKLAQGIYEDRAFDRLPILADALEEAGCHDADILGHCRHPGPHVRGCWVVDLLTGSN